MIRVTRLGEFFSPFILGTFSKITEVTHFFGILFSTTKVMAKMGWDSLWAIFSKPHLVTLVMINKCLFL
jgi:hypothetical protein